ncbi:MAG: histidine phosphatase family protein [Candidatus Parcubacteria bacterium]|nr:histidine phosphatase family protein [Candidatus Parcubacteria bacterium]
MGWPKRIVMVRHAESEGNARGRDDESLEQIPNFKFHLTEKGIAQAQATGKYLREKFGDFKALFTSTYLRTQETLAAMYGIVPFVIDSRLNEHWRGIWHTMPKQMISEFYPQEERIAKREGWYHHRAPGGQACQDVELAIHSFNADLREFYANENVLIVCHGSWMILYARVIQQLSLAEAEHRHREKFYQNASITIYEGIGNELRVTLENFVPK